MAPLSAPDPTNPESFNHRHLRVTSGHTYHFIDQAPVGWVGDVKEARTVLLLHGFPDLWFGWRYQIHYFASRGYRVICPSQLGYHTSSSPLSVEAYSFKSVCYDINSLLDLCGAGKVMVVGHDWGGMIAWRMAGYFPERCVGVVAVCTPYQAPATPQTRELSTEDLIRNYMPNFGYQLYFLTDEAVNELGEVVDLFLQPMHSPNHRRQKRVQAALPRKTQLSITPTASLEVKSLEGNSEGPMEMSSWVKEGRLQASVKRQLKERREGGLERLDGGEDKELNYYISSYRHSTLRGALNWYRNRPANFRHEVQHSLRYPTSFSKIQSDIPCLQMPAELDAALPVSMCLSENVVAPFREGGNLEVVVVKGGDHWCLQDERTRNFVNETIFEFIERVFNGRWKPNQGRYSVEELREKYVVKKGGKVKESRL